MALPSLPILSLNDSPRTAEGKRNFAWSAVHPGEKPSGPDTLPEAEGGFADLLDIINPLQHIPILGSIYRALTGDTISAPGRIFGDLLFGGPLGFLGGIASTLMAETVSADTPKTVAAAYGRHAATTPTTTTSLRI